VIAKVPFFGLPSTKVSLPESHLADILILFFVQPPVADLHLVADESWERLQEITQQLAFILGDVSRYRKLLHCRGEQAQALLDFLQMASLLAHRFVVQFPYATHTIQASDNPALDAHLRRSLVVAMQRLSAKTSLYPKVFDFKGISLVEDNPVFAGGFADIYKGRLGDRFVCLKMIRVFESSQVDYVVKVRFFLCQLQWRPERRIFSNSHVK